MFLLYTYHRYKVRERGRGAVCLQYKQRYYIANLHKQTSLLHEQQQQQIQIEQASPPQP